MLDPLLSWLEATRLAATIRDSLPLTAFLSALHVLGVAVIGGAAIVSALRLSGLALVERPIAEVIRPAARGILVGLLINLTTGGLLFATRASAAAANDVFQIKMFLLVLGIATQAAAVRAFRPGSNPRWFGRAAAAAVLLVAWLGVVLAGSAFILLE
jgi:hypothetical protein